MLAEIPPPAAPEPPPAPWSPLASFGLAIAVLAAELFVQAAILLLFPPLTRSHNFGLSFTVTTLLSAPVGVLLILQLVRRRGLPFRDYLGLRLPTARQAWAALALLAVFNLAYDQLTRALHRPLVPEFMLNAYRTAHGLPGLYLAVAVAAPVFEELLFRGFLLPGLAATLGAVAAALLSSATFALLHLQYDLFDMTSVFLLGLLLAGVRLKTGSTLLTMALHLATNLVATLQVAWVLGRG
jgi:CAAX protease family protein